MKRMAIAFLLAACSGLVTLVAGVGPQEDCIPYDPNGLAIEESLTGWTLVTGTSRLVILDTEADAQAVLTIARRHKALCFIGRQNKRPNRLAYIVQYWKS